MDRDEVRIEGPQLERSGHRGDHIGGGQGAVQQQHPDQGTSPRGVAQARAGSVPESLMGRGEHPGRAGVGQGGGPGQGAGFAGQDLQVVVQLQVLGVFVQRPGVGGHDHGVREGLDGAGAETDL